MRRFFLRFNQVMQHIRHRSDLVRQPARITTQKIVFFHIPKCGGSSVVQAISKCFKPKQVFLINAVDTRQFGQMIWQDFHESPQEPSEGLYQFYTFKFREYVLLYALACQYAFIDGHVLFSQHAYTHFKPFYHFITMVRDPIQRFVSQYRFSASDQWTLDEYLEQPHAVQQGNLLVQYFSGNPDKTYYATQAQLVEAIDHIDKFDLIGLLENLDLFQQEFLNLFKVELMIPHVNKGMASPVTCTDAQKKKISKLCEFDIILYEEIRKRKMPR